MAREETALGTVPSWARVAAYLGVPSLISLFLVYQLAEVRSKQMERIEMKADLMRLEFQRVHAALYAICLNTAQDRQADIARCAILATDAK